MFCRRAPIKKSIFDEKKKISWISTKLLSNLKMIPELRKTIIDVLNFVTLKKMLTDC